MPYLRLAYHLCLPSTKDWNKTSINVKGYFCLLASFNLSWFLNALLVLLLLCTLLNYIYLSNSERLVYDVRMRFAVDLFISLYPFSQKDLLLYAGNQQISGVRPIIVHSDIQSVDSSRHKIPLDLHTLKLSYFFSILLEIFISLSQLASYYRVSKSSFSGP